MKRRYTTEVLASGQPRPYADSILHVRVTFEWNGFKDRDAPLEPHMVTERMARSSLLRLQCGFTETTRETADDWASTRLDWLRPIDAVPDRSPVVASVWEFHVTIPFTD